MSTPGKPQDPTAVPGPGEAEIPGARYVHTNLVARDWRALAAFYVSVLGCKPVGPERRLSGPEIEDGTGIPGARIEGAHLALPGWPEGGPTLEIFAYTPDLPHPGTDLHRPGFGHLAFAVPDVASAREAVLAAGGHPVGEIVRHEVEGAGTVTWCYVTDPEGNGLELQSWS